MNATPFKYLAVDLEKKVLVKVDGINFALNQFWGQELESHLKHDYSMDSYVMILFTGFLDKSDQEIWESDIVDMGSGVKVVMWCPKIGGFIFQNCNGETMHRDNQKNYVKLGNKYLNPELVEKYNL